MDILIWVGPVRCAGLDFVAVHCADVYCLFPTCSASTSAWLAVLCSCAWILLCLRPGLVFVCPCCLPSWLISSLHVPHWSHTAVTRQSHLSGCLPGLYVFFLVLIHPCRVDAGCLSAQQQQITVYATPSCSPGLVIDLCLGLPRRSISTSQEGYAWAVPVQASKVWLHNVNKPVTGMWLCCVRLCLPSVGSGCQAEDASRGSTNTKQVPKQVLHKPTYGFWS